VVQHQQMEQVVEEQEDLEKEKILMILILQVL
jgi:hypothetical protein